MIETDRYAPISAMSALPSSTLRPLIYIVDDDEAVRTSLTLLAHARGWDVCVFDSAIDYLEHGPNAPDDRPSCLVLDLQMPDMDGAQLQERLQRRERQIPTVIISAWPDSEQARRALAAGARTVIAKPFAPSEWVGVVEKVLEAV